jgi:hypothetical protein
MVLRSLILALFFAHAVAFGQKDEQLVMQQAIEQKDFVAHLKRQILFDLSETMVYTLPYDLKNSGISLKFQGKELLKTVETPDEPILLVNFDFKKISVKGSKARVKYSFYPFWKVCEETGPSPSYSNGLYMTIDARFKKTDGKWVMTDVEIEDMDFGFSKGIPGYGCLNRHYIPF